MPMICPRCLVSFENHRQCPRCAMLLEYRVQLHTEEAPGLTPRWHQTPAGRMVSGLLLALGLSYCLLALVGSTAGKDTMAPVVSLSVFLAAQAFAVGVGGMLAGVGRRGGWLQGLAVGLVSGCVVLLLLFGGLLDSPLAPFASEYLKIPPPLLPTDLEIRSLVVFLLPLLHALCGALGGLMGCLTWKPPPELNLPVLVSKPEKRKDDTGLRIQLPTMAAPAEESMLRGRISWFRILVGIGVAIFGGSFGTEPVKNFIVNASEGGLVIRDQMQNQVTLGEIFALSILIGGVIAGSNSKNGLKQGLIVGVGAGLGMVPFLMDTDLGEYTIFVVLSAGFIAPLGGWFGSNLLPPPPPPKYTQGAVG